MKVSVTEGEKLSEIKCFSCSWFCAETLYIYSLYVHVYFSAYTQNMHTYFLNYENIAYRLRFPDVLFSVSFGHIYISAGRETAVMWLDMYLNSSKE